MEKIAACGKSHRFSAKNTGPYLAPLLYVNRRGDNEATFGYYAHPEVTMSVANWISDKVVQLYVEGELC